MRAGDLDRRIVIQAEQLVPDGGGGWESTWVPIATVWASVQQTAGREFLSAQAVTAERRVVFRIRWRAGISTDNRIAWDNAEFDINEVREIGRREGLELHATERS